MMEIAKTQDPFNLLLVVIRRGASRLHERGYCFILIKVECFLVHQHWAPFRGLEGSSLGSLLEFYLQGLELFIPHGVDVQIFQILLEHNLLLLGDLHGCWVFISLLLQIILNPHLQVLPCHFICLLPGFLIQNS